ncbi:MAG: TetR/AcrR family transcriptional regulator [Thermocrispum sp.]
MTTASTPKGERRRAALVEAGAQLLVESGFDAVRHRGVAERAGLPLASTTYYFDSLDDLVAAVVQHQARRELERGRQRLGELATRQRGVGTIVDLMLDNLLGPQQATTEADAEYVLLRYERLVATGRRQYLRPLMHTLGVELRELLAEVFARSGMPVTAEELERHIALVDGAVVNALIEVDPEPRSAAARMLTDVLS